jgi:multidrug resistance efflux pump
MSTRKRHAYEVALRMAQVKELRAQMALADAVDKENAAKCKVATAESARDQVFLASQGCIADGRNVDLARYELLSHLSFALTDSLQRASGELEQAADRRMEKASENVLAKRHRERVGEHLDDERLALAHGRAAKAQEEGIELWLESSGEAS